jgi:hypothetical protein
MTPPEKRELLAFLLGVCVGVVITAAAILMLVT